MESETFGYGADRRRPFAAPSALGGAGAAAEGEQLGEEGLPVGAEELALCGLRGWGSFDVMGWR